MSLETLPLAHPCTAIASSSLGVFNRMACLALIGYPYICVFCFNSDCKLLCLQKNKTNLIAVQCTGHSWLQSYFLRKSSDRATPGRKGKEPAVGRRRPGRRLPGYPAAAASWRKQEMGRGGTCLPRARRRRHAGRPTWRPYFLIPRGERGGLQSAQVWPVTLAL